MALIPITQENIENVTLVLHPERTIVSSSHGVTGTIKLVERPSSFLRKISEDKPDNAEVNDNQLEGLLKAASNNFNSGISDVSGIITQYMQNVNAQPQPDRNFVSFSPVRYQQPVNFSDDYNGSPYLMKRNLTQDLMSFYRHGYDFCDFSCTNYNVLNFFSSSFDTNSNALIYANTSSLGRPYTPTSEFSVDFYINPRHKFASGSSFTAGTILHLSSTLAISLTSGSLRDQNQDGVGFRLLLQMSQSADVAPSSLNLTAVESGLSFPSNLTFITPDNSLLHNKWHHVTVRWGGPTRSYGTGSIVIDGNQTYFNVPSSTISTSLGPDALVVGNYYNGADAIGKFFNSTSAYNEGLPEISGFTTDPTNFSFNNPLQAEIHDLKIFNRYLSDIDVDRYSSTSDSKDPDLMFYLPPAFSTLTNEREVLVTPFQSVRKKTYSPFNADMALSVNGFYMNLENYVKDYITGQFPRLYNLTASMVESAFDQTANDILYSQSGVSKRNLMILPNDNGRQIPDFSILSSESSVFFSNDLGNTDHSIISMRNIAGTSSFLPGVPDVSGMFGPTPENITATVGSTLTIAQRFKDASSNQVVIFDLTTLGYGRRILPNTFEVTDNNLTSSHGAVSMTLQDNGNGSIYRADCLTKKATWNSVGNIFYVEGTAILTNPTLALFGKDQFNMSLKGEQRTNVFVVNAPAPASLINSSSNPSYQAFPVTDFVSEREDRFVYITGINLHDENLNVIMRANLAQPVAKRESDEFLFRLKYDF